MSKFSEFTEIGGMGTEGDGLPKETITDADYVVRIPMAHGVNSLNVAAASAIAFWELVGK